MADVAAAPWRSIVFRQLVVSLTARAEARLCASRDLSMGRLGVPGGEGMVTRADVRGFCGEQKLRRPWTLIMAKR